MSLTSGEGAVPFTMPVQPAYSGNGSNGGNGMWGGDGAWWIILFFIFAWGWGGFGGGYGANGGGGINSPAGQGALTRGDLCMDMNFQEVKREVQNANDAVNLGFANLNSTICKQAYETAGLINGLGNTVQQGFNAANVAMLQGFNAQNIAQLQGQNALQTQIAQCCCDNREAIAGLKYDMATSDCSIKTLINQLAQQLMWGQQSGIRDLTELINSKFCQLELSQKDAVIADLRTKLAACGDQTTAQYIINQITGVISPRAVPAYPASAPCGLGNWAPQVLANSYGYNPANSCGCNTGCGCNGFGLAA